MPSADPNPENPPTKLSAKTLLGAVVLLAACTAYLWFIVGVFSLDSFGFAFQLHFVLMFAAANLDQMFKPTLNSPRFRVRPGELKLYRGLGVIQFMRLLQVIGWTRLMNDKSVFDGTRATLGSYEEGTRHGENCHLWIFIVVLAPMAWASSQGMWRGVLWMGALNIFLHLYPCMLQRTQRVRLQRCMQRMDRRDKVS